MSALLFIFIISVPSILTEDPTMDSPEHYCFVQSPIDLSIFNLTTIQHKDRDSIIRVNETEHLRVHFCKELNDPCNGKQDYAICLHTNDKEIGVGKEPPDVAINSGKIMFRYSGDKCNETHNYNVDVEMKCHFSKKEKVGTHLDIVYNRDECSFQIIIKTFAACSKRKLAECELRDKTGYYNFAPLMNLEDNYKIIVDNSTSVILNICHSLIYGHHFHQCDHDTMVCLVNDTINKPTRYTRLGNVNDEMRFVTKNGSVLLELTSDTPCGKEDSTKLKTVRTTIEFVCSERATTAMPEYKSGLGTCHYRFRWPTATACSEDVLIRLSNLEHQPCKITDMANNLYYDLSTLAGTVFYVNSSSSQREYEISICAPLKDTNCTKEGTGICKYLVGKGIAVSKGQANTKLMWRRNQVYLNYTDGMACGKNLRSFTIIVFQCAGTNNSMILDDKDPCATVIIWTSVSICKTRYDIERLMEVLQPDNLYHWPVLSRYHMNYIVKGETNNTQYHLNVGMPLVEDGFTTCVDESSACRVIMEDGKRISELNLGSQDTDTHITNDGLMYLRYRNGSICEEDESKRISAQVFFKCDFEAHAVKDLYFNLDSRYPSIEFLVRFLKIVQGKPTFRKYSDCKYEFDWVTTHACFLDERKMGKVCHPADNAVAIFNFTYLLKNDLFKVNEDQYSGYFSAKHCKEQNKCNGTFVCNKIPIFGNDSVKTKPDSSKPLIAFKFVNETKCEGDAYYESVLLIWCGLWSGIAEVFLLKEGECKIGLNWDEYITECHLNGDITDGDAYDPKDHAILRRAFYGYVVYSVLIFLGVGGLIFYLCCRRRCQRLFCRNDRRNYENNIRYQHMTETEPAVDLDLQDE